MFGPDLNTFIRELDKKLGVKDKQLELDQHYEAALALVLLRQSIAEVQHEAALEDANVQGTKTEDKD